MCVEDLLKPGSAFFRERFSDVRDLLQAAEFGEIQSAFCLLASEGFDGVRVTGDVAGTEFFQLADVARHGISSREAQNFEKRLQKCGQIREGCCARIEAGLDRENRHAGRIDDAAEMRKDAALELRAARELGRKHEIDRLAILHDQRRLALTSGGVAHGVVAEVIAAEVVRVVHEGAEVGFS